MCIRDSIYSTFPSAEAAETVGRALVEGRLVACANVLAGITSIYEWNGAIPVPYTHLRAHETVLDLVCRLLLEKKKFKPPLCVLGTLRPTISLNTTITAAAVP